MSCTSQQTYAKKRIKNTNSSTSTDGRRRRGGGGGGGRNHFLLRLRQTLRKLRGTLETSGLILEYQGCHVTSK